MNQDSKIYDVEGYSYPDYWKGREYEKAAEERAIRTLIGGKHFQHAVDVGGGYGRLTKFLANFGERVDLVEPSDQQRAFADTFLAGLPSNILEGDLEEIPVPDGSVDLVAVFRVLHHVPDLTLSFKEVSRVLKSGGYFLLEYANSTHFKARLKSQLSGRPIPKTPVSVANDATVTFVNHHPESIQEQLAGNGFVIERTLSVSNLRSQGLKRVVPHRALMGMEGMMQGSLGSLHFGPSVVLLARKK